MCVLLLAKKIYRERDIYILIYLSLYIYVYKIIIETCLVLSLISSIRENSQSNEITSIKLPHVEKWFPE